MNRLKEKPIKTVVQFVQSKMIRPLRKKVEHITSSRSHKRIQNLHNNHIKIYTDYDWSPVESKIQLLLTEKPDIEFNSKLIASWEKLTKKGVKVVPVKGHHDSLFLAPTAKETGQNIGSCMQDFENG